MASQKDKCQCQTCFMHNLTLKAKTWGARTLHTIYNQENHRHGQRNPEEACQRWGQQETESGFH